MTLFLQFYVIRAFMQNHLKRRVLKCIHYSVMQLVVLLPMGAYAYEPTTQLENSWVMRTKLGATIADSKEQKYISGVLVNKTTEDKQFFDSNISVELETDYFIHERFSLGGSIGYLPQKSTVRKFGTRVETGKVAAVPIAATAKFYIAPYGELSPYVSAGYHYTFFPESYKRFKFENSSGPVVGGGLDWWFQENAGVNLEAKQYFMRTEIENVRASLDNSVTKAKINPLIISVGFVYRFN